MTAKDRIKLYEGGSKKVRSVASADSGTWTPDDESDPDSVILDAREWEDLRIVAQFPSVNAGGTETVNVTPLVMVQDPNATAGRRWITLSQQTLGADLAHATIAVGGQFVAFRVDSVTLNGADSIDVWAMGNKAMRDPHPS